MAELFKQLRLDATAPFWRNVADLAENLVHQNVRRVGLVGDNSLSWIAADLACLMAGVVCVPLPPFFSAAQTNHVIETAALDGLIWTSHAPPDALSLSDSVALSRMVPAGAPKPLPPGTVKITFTSGTTGTPKGVCLGEQHIAATVAALRDRLGSLGIHQHLCTLPLSTLLENVAGAYLSLSLGAQLDAPPLSEMGMTGSSGLDATRWIKALNDYRPDSLILVPELANVLVQAACSNALKHRDFRFIAVGGGRVAPDLIHQGRNLGLPIYEGYGLSECGSVVALNSPDQDRPGTVGKPLKHVHVSIGEQNEILVQGNAHLGYLGEPTNKDTVTATGDLGSLTPEGFLTVEGRSKNVLITSFGRNISPEWLESEIIHATGARQAWVFGDGEPNPSALIFCDPTQTDGQLSARLNTLNQTLPDYARLRGVYRLPQPLTSSDGYLTGNGRLMRQNLQADLCNLLAAANPISLNSGAMSMNFFDRLQAETADARRHVMTAPVINAIEEGRFGLESYTWFLTQAYHHVKHTVPLMMACGARLPDRLEFVRKALVEYIDEEYGHQEWILNDLAACGADKTAIRKGHPDESIELMVAYLYDQIARGNPAAFFGMVQVLEGTSVELATPLGQRIQQQLGLPTEAFSYLYSHGALDQEHFEFFRDLMNAITAPEDQDAIIRAARMVYRLYGDMLHSVPLPDSREEAHHEAA